MCLILAAYRSLPDLELLVVANRDERYDRRTEYAHVWQEGPQIVAGKDLEAGGTWLGVSRSGRVAAVTNVREPDKSKSDARSRGELPVGFLGAEASVAHYVRNDLDRRSYNGFNLLLYDRETLAVVSNRMPEPILWQPGIHGISNGLPESSWPKVVKGKERLRAGVGSGQLSTEYLLAIMQDVETARPEELPDTGVGMAMEVTLSPPFIVAPAYGTRCTTIVRLRTGGELVFDEFTYRGSREITNHVQLQLEFNKSW